MSTPAPRKATPGIRPAAPLFYLILWQRHTPDPVSERQLDDPGFCRPQPCRSFPMPRARNLRYALASLLLCFMGLTAAACSDQSVEAALNSQYGGKILALLHPIEKGSLVYDADGKVLKGGPEDSWTLLGRVLVQKSKYRDDVLSFSKAAPCLCSSGSWAAPASPPDGNIESATQFRQAPGCCRRSEALHGGRFCAHR